VTPPAGPALVDPRPIRPFGGPVDAVVRPPGSKSLTNRALVAAALATGTSRLTGVLFADDTEAMLASVQALGARVEVDRVARAITVTGTGGRLAEGPVELHAALSGTTSRFIAALLPLGAGPFRLDGGEPLRARPMGPVLDAVRQLGATVTEEGEPTHLPVTVSGGAAGVGPGGEQAVVQLPGDISSQFISGLLLAGPCLPGGLRIELSTDPVSRPYLDMTVAVMAAFGAHARSEGPRSFVVAPGGYAATDYDIEPDASTASYFFATAAICGGRVRVEGLGRGSLQGDVRFVDALERMGCTVRRGDDAIEVVGGPLHGIDADFEPISDTAQTLAAVAAFAEGPTRVSGIGFIRRKETDRIAAVVAELRRAGVEAHEEDDGFVVVPGPLRSATIQTYDDHRMAMSFTLLGLRSPGISIADPGCVAKTFPDYFDVIETLRPRSNPVTDAPRVIAIDGPAGSGKSTVARAVAERTGLPYLDTGAMYRSVAFSALRAGVDPDDAEVVANLARAMELMMEPDGTVVVDGADATIEIRGPEVTRAVSIVAANPEVRREMRRRQREWAVERGGGVMEGRDIGTVVFPDAALKVYLDAKPEVRAARRSKEVEDLSYETVASDLARRDALDQGREDSPLREADDAHVIDTSDLSVEQIVDAILEQL